MKPYLKYWRKELTDVDESDIKFLTELPKQIGTYDHKPINLVYGPYGLYLKYNERNIGLLLGTVIKILKDPHGDHTEALVKAINYVKK